EHRQRRSEERESAIESVQLGEYFACACGEAGEYIGEAVEGEGEEEGDGDAGEWRCVVYACEYQSGVEGFRVQAEYRFADWVEEVCEVVLGLLPS
ncbi:hypothetical protein LINGRAHAP2_LOCUS23176, partial [Linum grandiflorum]